MSAIDRKIHHGYETVALDAGFQNEHVSDVVERFGLTASDQPLSEVGKLIARLTA